MLQKPQDVTSHIKQSSARTDLPSRRIHQNWKERSNRERAGRRSTT